MSSESVCWVTEQNSLFILETEKYFNLLVNQYKVHEAGWLRDYKNILYQYAVVSGLPSCLFYKCIAVYSVYNFQKLHNTIQFIRPNKDWNICCGNINPPVFTLTSDPRLSVSESFSSSLDQQWKAFLWAILPGMVNQLLKTDLTKSIWFPGFKLYINSV